MQLDVGAVAGKEVQLLTEGVAEKDRLTGGALATADKAWREKTFPVSLLDKAISVKLEHAKATHEADRRHILNCFAGEKDLEKEALAEHPNFTNTDSRLHAKFAVSG